jgi:hypothetical protein
MFMVVWDGGVPQQFLLHLDVLCRPELRPV